MLGPPPTSPPAHPPARPLPVQYLTWHGNCSYDSSPNTGGGGSVVLDGGATCSHATLTANDCAWNDTRAGSFTIVVVARLDDPLPGPPSAPPPSPSLGDAPPSPGGAWEDPVTGPVLATLSHDERWGYGASEAGQLVLTPSVFMRETALK